MQLSNQGELLKALRRIEGQVRGIHKMIEEGRDCVDVVRQMTATRAALDALAHRTVADNVRACVNTADLSPEAVRNLEHGLSALKGMRL
jgi:DNA-binding FrmR family transcriptional regulator